MSDAAGNKLETTITLKETDLDENSPTVGNTTISYAENQTAERCWAISARRTTRR
ncbi:hypothetical protein [Aeromonas veronii]|uniref:hypothetical protein n=1 Tax=Aeromonas veronii TaxID=654 RepID=UPI00208E8826|nr:hypothetical protein [Aeromonas veronii]USP59174.1 hypothetical protein J6598_04355 [Aeromonas veronii]